MSIRVIVVPHDPNWHHKFIQEAQLIRLALNKNLVAIHHIGSTNILKIHAKPVIDMLVEVQDITQVDQQSPAMLALGYESMGEHGIPGRRFFRKDNAAGMRTHHVHTFAVGDPAIDRHLAFRNYLIAHPEVAQRYSNLKRALADRLDPHDIDGYMDGKHQFIKDIEKRAIAWRQSLTVL
jgi:GrpB-like predicted nucleotidyltransferase (UPF0157 family)